MYSTKRESTKKQYPHSIQGVYRSNPKAQNPYLEPSQSKKLTREEGLKTIDTLTQDQRLHTKEMPICLLMYILLT